MHERQQGLKTRHLLQLGGEQNWKKIENIKVKKKKLKLPRKPAVEVHGVVKRRVSHIF
jgi:hypothetical protein